MAESYEVEVKVPIADIEMSETKLLASGAKFLNSEVQVDIYFDHPCRKLGKTDEAVRVRTRRPLDTTKLAPSRSFNELTYKGPKIDKKTKTRLEYTVGIDDTDSLSAILQSLGFKRVGTIIKKRKFYSFGEITVSIDDVESVGLFLELESIAHGKKEMELAKKAIFDLLDELGFDPQQSIRDSYLQLFMYKK
jgi:adenylate cyclase class 2